MNKCVYFNPMYMSTKCAFCQKQAGTTCASCGFCQTCHAQSKELLIATVVMGLVVFSVAGGILYLVAHFVRKLW